jgi:nicotinate-nucleotide adenylyltransferase
MIATASDRVRRIGVFGGTFDPPHNGHLVAAAAARDALGLDEVLLTVAGEPWQKTGSTTVTPSHHRLAMAELLVGDVDGLVVSDVEVRRSGPTYTVDTLASLASPQVHLVLIVGSDALAGMTTWHRPADVMALADIAVVDRHGADPDPEATAAVVALMPPDRQLHRVGIPRLDISSSDLRERMRQGLAVCGLLPQAVSSYAAHHCIYRDQP